MKISVIIPTFNEETTIEKTLDAISRLVNVDEIIIVDGGSIDKTAERIENFETVKEIKLVRVKDSNRGMQLHEVRNTLRVRSFGLYMPIRNRNKVRRGKSRKICGLMRLLAGILR